METKILAVCGMVLASVVSGCAYDRGPGGPGGGVSVGVGDYYDGYYDGFYGPFNDGYWGNDGGFWFDDGHNNWRRDEGHHFQRQTSRGFNHIHGKGARREH